MIVDAEIYTEKRYAINAGKLLCEIDLSKQSAYPKHPEPTALDTYINIIVKNLWKKRCAGTLAKAHRHT